MPPEVRIHQTAALTEHCEAEYGEPWRAAERVVGLFEYGWERADHATFEIDVSVGREPVPAPIEVVQTSLEVDPTDDAATCATSQTTTYPDLLEWWTAYGRCADAVDLAADSNVLLTADAESFPNGTAEIGAAPFATANTGPGCAEAPDPYPYRRTPLQYGPAEEFEPVVVAIHEAGHNLMELNADHHASGRVRARSYPLNPTTIYTVSPMSSSELLWEQMVQNGGGNACGTDNEGLLDRIEAKDLVFSPCTTSAIAGNVETASADDAEWDGSADRETALRENAAVPTGLATGSRGEEVRPDASAADAGANESGEATPSAATDGSGGPLDGGRRRRPDVAVRDEEAREPVGLSVRSVEAGEERGPVRTLELGSGAGDEAAEAGATRDDTATSDDETTIGTLDLDSGRYEVEVRHGTAVDATPVVVGADGLAPDVTVRVRIRPDGSPVARTVVACGR